MSGWADSTLKGKRRERNEWKPAVEVGSQLQEGTFLYAGNVGLEFLPPRIFVRVQGTFSVVLLSLVNSIALRRVAVSPELKT